MEAVSRKTLVSNYLHTLMQQGVMRTSLTDEARVILRDWMRHAQDGTQAQASTARKHEPSEADSSKQDLDDKQISTETKTDPKVNFREVVDNLGHIPPAEKEVPQTTLHCHFELEGETARDRLLSLRELTSNWAPLRHLNTLRDTLVFSCGNPQADIMMVTDAPGMAEEQTRRPLSGPAGDKLDAMLKAMGLSRKNIYLTNLVKYRPSLPRQLWNNRPPSDKEITTSLPILEEEIRIVRPKIIVALGAIAAKGILKSTDAPLSSLRGRLHTVCDTPVLVTYHPSYLLRTEELSEKRKVWEDLLSVMKHVGLPITPKQQSYFLPKSS